MISGITYYKNNSKGSFNFKRWNSIIELSKEKGIKEISLFYDLKSWNAQIRKIELPTEDFNKFIIEVGLFESLGEQGGDILTLTYKIFPKKKEIIADIINYYEDLAEEFYNTDGELMITLSGREELQAKNLLCLKGGKKD